MFLCYGQEEYHDVVDTEEQGQPTLNFQAMLSQYERRQTRKEQRLAKVDDSSNTAEVAAVAQGRIKKDTLDANRYLDVDQSSFDLGETHLGMSRMDDVAQAYAKTLTPEALIGRRKRMRELRQARNAASFALQKVQNFLREEVYDVIAARDQTE